MIDYDTAQICIAGHVVTQSIEQYPHLNEVYCSECGKKTIMECQNCKAPIRGDCHHEYPLPDTYKAAYCYSCGSPYPWTLTAIETAKAIIQEDESLSDEQILQFCEYLPDLLVETQKSSLALIRFKKLIDKAASTTGPALLDLFKNVASEVMIKKILGS